MAREYHFSKVRELLSDANFLLRVIEALPPKAEQVQPPVRQQDAALVDDEPPGSAAGNPDGEWIEAFEVWLDEQIEAADIHYRRHPDATTANLPILLKMLRGKFQDFKRQGAA